MIYLFTSRKLAALGLNEKNACVKLLPMAAGRELSALKAGGYEIQADDQIYLDISSLSQAELKKSLGQLKKNTIFWGIIDPKGSSDDPALFFFEGAGDYIGPVLVKKGLTIKRFTAALSCTRSGKTGAGNTASKADYDSVKRKAQKLPTGKFEGWKSIRTGTEWPFLFLFVSISGKANLRTMLGETAFTALKSRLREVLQQGLLEANALLWMETENNSLLLVPPRKANGQAAIEAALKMLLNNRIIAMERLGLSIPVELTFALHYGQTLFQAPGKTGAVISESINYIFHLGAKKAEAGRLTISGDVPEETLPDGLKDLFDPAGVFEGIPIRHSKRFVYK